MQKLNFNINGKHYEATITEVEHNVAEVELNGKKYTIDVERSEAVASAPRVVAPAAAPAAVEATDETDMAAIAYVLHTFYNQHDEESDVLTIRHDDVAYSPWNQKSITF